jgi:hypothetical protein
VSLKKRLVYVAHPLGDGEDRPRNIVRASKWVAWAAEQGVAPTCTWIVLATQWDESRRDEELAIDLALIERCDEVWLCGPRVSKGMNIEATHAKTKGIPVHVLVDPSYTDGPPTKLTTFEEIVMKPANPALNDSVVTRHLAAMAKHHGYSYEDFTKLSYVKVFALERANPSPKQRFDETTGGTPGGHATVSGVGGNGGLQEGAAGGGGVAGPSSGGTGGNGGGP